MLVERAEPALGDGGWTAVGTARDYLKVVVESAEPMAVGLELKVVVDQMREQVQNVE